jgi:hypothetical protein
MNRSRWVTQRIGRHDHPLAALQQPGGGYVLLVAIIAGFILAISGLGLVSRLTSGQLGSIRQQQSREAREIAEAGLIRTMAALNSSYPYLLINCYVRQGSLPSNCKGSWQQPFLPSSICPGANTNWVGMPTTGFVGGTTQSPQGRFEVDLYVFQGTQFYGGNAILRVRGQRLAAGGSRVLAVANVEQNISIKPKNCDAAFNQPPANSGFPGLLASKVELANNDVIGAISGNVLCTECDPVDDVDIREMMDEEGLTYEQARQALARERIGALRNGVVTGNVFVGANITLPPVPQFPSGLTATPAEITDTTALVSRSVNGGRCAVDAALITHCRITTIDLSGNQKKQLSIDTTAGPMRLYVSGNISLAGRAALVHSGPMQNLAIYGNPRDANDDNDQTVTLSGGANGGTMFVYFPDATVQINGGSRNPAECDSTDDVCLGGDIRGAVWAKVWNGSSSNEAQLVVPHDMGPLMFGYFGPQFALSIRDYVALGSNAWGSFMQVP